MTTDDRRHQPVSKIFGYDWADIQAAQRGDMSGLRRPVNYSPKFGEWTEADQALLEQYQSVEALESAGFYGTADRAKRRERGDL